MNIHEITLPGNVLSSGVLIVDTPSDKFASLKESIKRKTTFKNILHKKSFMAENELEEVIGGQYPFELPSDYSQFIYEFHNNYCEYFNLKLHSIDNIKCWLNYLEATNYNPAHCHGGNISFVSWIKVPYSLQDEDRLPNVRKMRNEHKTNSRFSFLYCDQNNQVAIKLLDIDQNWVGKIMMFPSSLSHMVYPFYTSNEQRIALAGNLYYK